MLAVLAFTSGVPAALQAQNLGQSGGFNLPDIPVLTIEPDKLFAGSAFGQRLSAEIERRGTLLAAENRRIEGELADEEGELTGLRPTLSSEDFRKLADAFDDKVISKRAEQDEKARVLALTSEQAQRDFLQAIAPILEQMMNEKGAGVVLDRRAVFLSIDATDITAAAIARIDRDVSDDLTLDSVLPETDDSTVEE